jgi:hypothetical protein
MKPLDTEWTREAKDKKAVENLVNNSTAVLGLLRKIVQRKIEAQQRAEISQSVYDNPSWAHKQAHINGRMQVLRELDQLLNTTGE